MDKLDNQREFLGTLLSGLKKYILVQVQEIISIVTFARKTMLTVTIYSALAIFVHESIITPCKLNFGTSSEVHSFLGGR